MLKFLFGKKPAIDVAATFREAGALHDQGRLVEIHEKYPLDKGRRKA